MEKIVYNCEISFETDGNSCPYSIRIFTVNKTSIIDTINQIE